MAAGFLSPPGSEFGPCENECKHKDCADTRRIAAALCRVCTEPIGYDRRFYQENNWTQFVHAVCAEEEAEASTTQKGSA